MRISLSELDYEHSGALPVTGTSDLDQLGALDYHKIERYNTRWEEKEYVIHTQWVLPILNEIKKIFFLYLKRSRARFSQSKKLFEKFKFRASFELSPLLNSSKSTIFVYKGTGDLFVGLVNLIESFDCYWFAWRVERFETGNRPERC